MKLAFTTLGCPDWDLDTIIARAREYGFDGVDFRGYKGEMDVPALPEFTTGLATTARRLRDAGLEVPCLSSGIVLMPGDGDRQGRDRDELSGYLRLCEAFGARYVRVFGGHTEGVERPQATAMVTASLAELVPMAERSGVTLLLETHDSWVRSEDIRPVIEGAASRALGVLWDIHHPYRAGETPEQTWAALGTWIRYTHWKDARGPDDGELCLFGEGNLPLGRFLDVLRSGGYTGYLTLEWERKWHPDLDPPEVAFPGFVRTMRALMAS